MWRLWPWMLKSGFFKKIFALYKGQEIKQLKSDIKKIEFKEEKKLKSYKKAEEENEWLTKDIKKIREVINTSDPSLWEE